MKKLQFILATWIFISCELALSSEIKPNNAILSDGGISPRTELQKAATISMSSVLKTQGIDPYSAVASTNMDESSMWYRLYNDSKIYAVDVANKKYVGNWLLGRWPGESDLTNKKIYDLDLGSGITQAKPWDKPQYQGEQITLGCLGSNPLRYGDIDGDGKQELVTYLQDGNLQQDWIVFSPEKKTVTFSVRLALQDYLPSDEPDPKLNGGFQYISDENQREMHPGIRIYAKVFIDEFNGNTNKDILVWRKRYITLKKDNPKKGFQLETEVINHYELINGAYTKQATDTATLKTWLAAKQLTWQKGYPSKSECKGQENQLIPEMHDPLLNDPEVLN